MTPEAAVPRIYVWCNSCSHEWHGMVALAEDGTCLAQHVCSAHGFAAHDMGIEPTGWQRDKYEAHYPDGFVVEWVENAREHAGLDAAYALNQQKAKEATEDAS